MTYRNTARLMLLTTAVMLLASQVSASIRSAKRDMSRLRYDRAETELVEIAKNAKGNEKQEALFLLAGLKKTVSEAEIVYQEVIRMDSKNSWGKRAGVELAKIQYALGNYHRSYDIIDQSDACGSSDEACFFQGLSAAMLNRYEDARETLVRVRGEYQPWAFLSIAEIDMKLNNPDSACRKYRAMSKASISPTAMYRYGECLEKEGDTEGAAEVFQEIIREFAYTPESVLASHKLKRYSDQPLEVSGEPFSAVEPPTSGFTLQFGSFYDRRNAIKLASELKRNLPGVRIDSSLLNSREIHRVRFGYFASRAEAQSQADELSRTVGEPFTVMTLP